MVYRKCDQCNYWIQLYSLCELDHFNVLFIMKGRYCTTQRCDCSVWEERRISENYLTRHKENKMKHEQKKCSTKNQWQQLLGKINKSNRNWLNPWCLWRKIINKNHRMDEPSKLCVIKINKPPHLSNYTTHTHTHNHRRTKLKQTFQSNADKQSTKTNQWQCEFFWCGDYTVNTLSPVWVCVHALGRGLSIKSN